MNTKLKSRLEGLEESARQHCETMANAIMQASSAALSNGDLETLRLFLERYVRSGGSAFEEALASCTPEEAAAVERLNAAGEAAALRIKGPSVSKRPKPRR